MGALLVYFIIDAHKKQQETAKQNEKDVLYC